MQIILLPTIVPTRFSRKTKEKNKKNLLNVTKLSDLASNDVDAAAPTCASTIHTAIRYIIAVTTR